MRVRFAPSPTGFLHLGGLRTALFNFLLARKHPNGKFILRIEDTDRTRLVPNAIESLQETLKWSGIEYDEGPNKPSKFGPFIQSDRLDIYKAFAEEFAASGKAYYCFCDKERLERTKTFYGKYDGLCRSLSKSEAKARIRNGELNVLRFKSPPDSGLTSVEDRVYGTLKAGNAIDDVVLMKSDGYPTYHFANVIDDHLMEIDLVMRGAEWIPSTPLHSLLYDAFGWKKPQFAHLPLLINSDRTKLSKRQDSAHVSHYIRNGFLPSALNNFVAFLGWTPTKQKTKEVFDMAELIDEFELKGINSADATVNFDKLKWLNRQHLKLNSNNPNIINEFRNLIHNKYPNGLFDQDYLARVIKTSAERAFFLNDISDMCAYFFEDPNYEGEEFKTLFESKIKTKDLDSIKSLESYKDLKSPPLLRIIMTGVGVGPPVQEIIEILGEKVCQNRFEKFKSVYFNQFELKV